LRFLFLGGNQKPLDSREKKGGGKEEKGERGVDCFDPTTLSRASRHESGKEGKKREGGEREDPGPFLNCALPGGKACSNGVKGRKRREGKGGGRTIRKAPA